MMISHMMYHSSTCCPTSVFVIGGDSQCFCWLNRKSCWTLIFLKKKKHCVTTFCAVWRWRRAGGMSSHSFNHLKLFSSILPSCLSRVLHWESDVSLLCETGLSFLHVTDEMKWKERICQNGQRKKFFLFQSSLYSFSFTLWCPDTKSLTCEWVS